MGKQIATKGEKMIDNVIVFDEFIESRQLSEKIIARKFEIGNFSLQTAESFLMLSEMETGDIYGEKKKIAVNRFCHSSDNWDIGNTVIYWIIS